MKRQRVSGANISPAGICLGHTCGTNIDTEGVDFTRQQPNLMYIDKVFSFNEDTASPILFNLNTGGLNSDYYISELVLDGCSIFPCTLSPNAVFEIDNSYVVVEYFNTRQQGSINASQVTVDGFPVDSVSFDNGQYTARTQNVLSRIQRDRCLNCGLPTKAFFMVNNAGPWDFRATYILEGTVNTSGRICRFRAKISNAEDAPNTPVNGTASSSFAVRNLSLPCSINGISPDISFQFSAKINLINPKLVVNCELPISTGGNIISNCGGTNRRVEGQWLFPKPDPEPIPCPPIPIPPCPEPIPCPPIPPCPPCPEPVPCPPCPPAPPCPPCPPCPPAPPCPPCPPCPPAPPCPPCPPCPPVIISPILTDTCTVSLRATVSVEPVIHVQTVRRTLFCVNACEGVQPCQGSITAAAEEQNREDCRIGGLDRPDCSCPGCSNVGGISDCSRNQVEGISCGNRNLGGVSVGTGPCNCNNNVGGVRDECDGRVGGVRDECDGRVGGVGGGRDGHVAGISGGCNGNVAGTWDLCGRRNSVLGAADRHVLEKLLEEIAGELADDCSDVAGIGFAPDGTYGCGDRDNDRVAGASERLKDEARTAFQLHGSNGCSW